MADRETAFAKINLALHVRRRRVDGYHDLETLFAFAADGDVLHGVASNDLSLTVEGAFAGVLAADDPADNLVLRAAGALRAAFGVTAGATLTLDKRLPVAAGIGGGSADAAAALRLLARLWRLPSSEPRIATIAASLGADVPACLGSVTARGDARGDRLVRVDATGLAAMPLLLVNPLLPLSTASVFAAWDGQDRGALADGDPWAAALSGRNDLESPARALVPAITGVLDALGSGRGGRLVRMSGSGATCFALYESMAARDAAAASIAAAHPEWWRLATTLRQVGSAAV